MPWVAVAVLCLAAGLLATGIPAVRARIQGDVQHIQVWMNGGLMTDWTDSANYLPDAVEEGMIAVQIHGGSRCTPGLYHRYRNVAVKLLPWQLDRT